MTPEQIFGWLGAFFVTIILIPQIIKAFKTKHTEDLSMLMLIFSAMGNGFWAAHAMLTDNIPLIVGASLIMLMSIILIIYKMNNENKPESGE